VPRVGPGQLLASAELFPRDEGIVFGGRPDAAGETFRRNDPSLRNGCLRPSRGRASLFRLSLLSVGSRDVAEKREYFPDGRAGSLGNDDRCHCWCVSLFGESIARDNLRMNRKSAMIINQRSSGTPRGEGAAWRGKMLLKEIRREAQRERVPRKGSGSLAEHGHRSIIRSPEDKLDARNASGVGCR